MELDLESLPLFFAGSQNYLIVNKKPSVAHLDSLEQLNITPPGFILREEIQTKGDSLEFPINKLCPWGWSPAEHKFLSHLKPNCSTEFKKSPVFKWMPHHRDIYSKKFASGILHRILEEFPDPDFIPKEHISRLCKSKKDIEELVEHWGQLMIKAPWSSSGRGLQTLRKTPVHPKVWDKILGMINDQGYTIVEPYLNKVLDLAYQFEIKKGKVTFAGTSNFSTDYKGQYNGNSLNGLPDHLNNELVEFVHSLPEKIIPPVIEVLEKSELALYYEGVFGLDTLIYLNKKNELRVNPCLEINVRQNMGYLSVFLEQLVLPNKKAVFRTHYKPGTTYTQFAEEMNKKHPLILNNSRIESGFFSLIDTKRDTLFGAYILV